MRNLTRMVWGKSRRVLTNVAVALLGVSAGAGAAFAQGAAGRNVAGAIAAGGDEALYLRALAMTDSTALPSLLQPFSAEAARRLQGRASEIGPWASRYASPRGSLSVGGVALQLITPEFGLTYHSAMPLSRNDGPIWAGRGSTVHAFGGVAASWKWLSLQLAPVLFTTDNANFDLLPTGRAGVGVYADRRFANNIDAPQRFGPDRYSRVDLGESSIRAEAFGVTAGLSNARLNWGPGREHSVVMSPNAGGFAHAFVGTSRPLNIYLGHVEGRLIGGRLEQSDYSPVLTGERDRFTSGFIGSFRPRLLPALEFGATRVMQVAWPEGGPSLAQILRPFQTVISDPQTGATPNQNNENQYASAFVRIAPAASGFEAYAELGREDFSGNLRWAITEPEDLAVLLLGFAHAKRGGDGELRVLRAELINGETSHTERGDRGLNQPIPPYTHGRTRQGLTNRGQVLGSPVAYGGSGATLSYERFTRAGKRLLAVERQLRLDWRRGLGGSPGTRQAEALWGVRWEESRFVGARELTLSAAPSLVLNRNLEAGRDVWNLEFGLRWRGW